MSNLKQIGLAAGMYAQDYLETLPAYSNFDGTYWPQTLSRYGLKYTTQRTSSSFICPSQLMSLDYYYGQTVNYQWYKPTAGSVASGAASYWLKISRVTRPSNTFLCSDAVRWQPYSGMNYAIMMTNYGSHLPISPWIHSNGVNVLFIDGHVDYITWANRDTVAIYDGYWYN
ncbi:MAG: hypothetical protein NC911_04170 [Candidatus Omnitrophica bacterium]|nr:hypothetical protein [Candidatus Omnitrophota bacterium]